MAAIPVVDLAPFWQDKGVVVGRMPTKDQLSVASQIDEANREFGFIAVRNFGLSKAEVETYFRAAKKLFALSPESKDTLIAAEVLDTGYVAPNRQEVNHRGLQAPKESYLVGNDAGYLNCPAAFRTSSGKLYSRLDELNKRYCAATALALGLRDTNIVWSMHQSSDLVRIRYNHYPPLNSQEIQDFPAVRFGAHTDFGTQTFLLLQGGANGLEIQPPGLQDWIEAKVPEDIFCVINIGDMWETMTNGRWLVQLSLSVVRMAVLKT